MSLSLLFTISSIYLGLVGLGTLISPTAMTAGALSPLLVDTFRGFGGAFLAVAVMDWMARNSEASKARDAIVLGNTIGFVFAAVFGIFAVLHGYPAYGWVLVVINALLAVGFFLGGMSGMSAPAPSAAKAAPQPSMSAASAAPAKTRPDQPKTAAKPKSAGSRSGQTKKTTKRKK